MAEGYNFISNMKDMIPEIPVDSIISRTVHDDEGVKVVLFGFAEGQELSEHTASQPAMLTFLDGDAQLTLGDDPYTAEPGTWVYLPPHLPHSVQATSTVVMMLVLLKD
ncbi:MAG: cupin domain-containing protein [Anaerolineaceae bacterium]|nr:MAG: cupin domain-containing protein [Anaerolineaceae bacterium]